MSDSIAQRRVPHSSETCAECAALLRLLGDRDQQIRSLMARVQRNDRAADDLAEVVSVLDGAGVTQDSGSVHARLTVAGRVKRVMETR